MKIALFIGSRANYGRLYCVIKELINNSVDLKIILATEGRYIKNFEFDEYVDFKIDGLMYKDSHVNMCFTTSIIIQHISNYLDDNRPDIIIIHGDRYECLGVAITAAYQNIPICHTEGGEITGSLDNKVRYAISELANLHLVVSKKAYDNLQGHKNVFIVGSPVVDYCLNTNFPILEEKYILVVYNPNITAEENFRILAKEVDSLSNLIKIRWINPNIDPGNKDIIKLIHNLDNIEFIKSRSIFEFNTLLKNCNCLIGNTSAGIKEGAVFGIPYILIGDRQHNREHDINIIKTNFDEISKLVIENKFIDNKKRHKYNDVFGKGNSSELIFNKIKYFLKEV